MATLLHTETKRRIPLLPHHVVGRAPDCHLILDDRLCSSQHAAVVWTGNGWELRDLGSRNGTWVNGYRMPQGHRQKLDIGMVVAFGNPPNGWQLEELSPPTAGAIAIDGAQYFAVDGLLALPDEDAPSCTVFMDDDGRWWLEHADDTARPCRDREDLLIDGQPWRLQVPQALTRTTELEVERPFEDTSLTFHVEPRGDRVMIDALCGGVAIRLEPRSHLAALLTLARIRMQDTAAGRPPEDCGWVHRERLGQQLGLTEADLNVHIFRIRRHFATAGVEGASRIIERRSAEGLLRIGVHQLREQPLSA